MYMRSFTFFCAAVLTVALAGCSTSIDRTNAASRTTTDKDLERAIESRWSTVPGLKDLRVIANAARNEATLSGTVATQELRSQAVDLATGAGPGLTITDKIAVKPQEVARNEYTEEMASQAREKAKALGDKIGDSVDDAWIHAKITAKLIGDSETPARKINVDVVKNVVTLRGKVDTVAAKQEAVRIARETEGVKRVTDLLVVRPEA
jgi:hyperosmotically inducible periplasmic protein